MNDRFDQGSSTGKPKLSGIVPHPAEGMEGGEVRRAVHEKDPESGFSTDAAIASYRESLILYQARKYSEAILGFSSFLEKYADHPLAGSAQYYVGESYFQEREWGMATQEFQRVLTSYDRSPQVADSLKRLAACSDKLKRPDDASRYRQMLLALFPASPAAREDSLASASAAVSNPLKMPGQEERAQGPIEGEAVTGSPVEKIDKGRGARAEGKSDEEKSGYDGPPPTAPLANGDSAEKIAE